MEGAGLLHGGQREQLEQVVLDDVTRGADAVVVTGPAADADVLGHRDLHVVDVTAVPDRLPHRVGEAQRQDVLDRLLAEVVVDPEDLVRREDVVHELVELLRALQVVAERLLDDGAPPAAVLLVGQPVLLELLDDLGEELRRDGQVEGEVAARALRLVQLLDRGPEGLEGHVVVEVALHEAHALAELLPDLFAEGRTGMLLDGVVHDLGEVLVLPVAAREADEREARRQQAAVGQVIDGGHQLFTGQIARDAKDDQARRPRDAREPSVLGVTERVGSGNTRQSGQPSEGARRLSSASVELSRSVQAASNFSTPSSSRSWTTSS